jgi:chromate reductase, NAD(P)H dehydrogenase (quinone)
MNPKKNILAIIGSASVHSANLQLVEKIAALTEGVFELNIYQDLKTLPHFDPELSLDNTPESIVHFRKLIEVSDGVIICTPEYVFSIPSGLKNALEWCVATTLFTDKACGLITASASGVKGHEELQLIMKTLMAKFNPETTLLIQGVKGKFDEQGNITESKTQQQLEHFTTHFIDLVNNH